MVINVPDTDTLPVIVPNTEPSQDDYQQSNAENNVVTKASMNTARQGLQAVTLNGMIYAIGGQTTTTGGYTNSVELYNPSNNTWMTVASMNTARSYFGAVAYNGKIYVMGGINATGYLNSMEYYDPATDVWTTMSVTLPVAMSSFSATLITGSSTVYVVGGYTGSYRSSVYEINLITGAKTTKTSLSVPISNHVAFYYNGNIYVEGGLTTGGAYTYNEYKYTISNGTTSSAVLARSSLSNASGIMTNDRFIAIGGKNSTSNYSIDITQSSLLTNNTTTRGYYISATHLLTARSGLGSAIVNGKVYIIGGLNSTGVLNSVEMMDMGWQQKASLPAPLSNYKSVQLDGKLYVMGGSANIGGSNLNSNAMYMYDPASDSWTTLSCTMPVYARDFSLTAGFSKIYMFGGLTSSTQNGTFTTSNQIYEFNPATSTWSAKNTLSVARSNLSSVLLNGLIYITGGLNGGGSATNTVEAYNPATNSIVTKGNLPSAFSNHFTTVLAGTIYLFTPTTSNTLKYNASSDSWSSVNPGSSYSGNLFVTLNNYLYILGMANDTSICPTFYKYLPVDNTSTSLSTFNYYSNLQQSIELNNKAYIFTGTDSTYSTGLVEYTPPATAWTAKAALNTSRYNFGAAVLDGSIYAAGGYNNSSALNTLEQYNETTNTWTAKAGMTYPRYGVGVVAANNKIYAIGGTSSGTVRSYVEAYTPSSNTWATKTAIPAATTDMAIATYNNIIYIIGGKNSSGTVLNTVRAYDTNTNAWSTKANIPTATFGSGAAVIGGKIYVVGGFTNSTTATSVLQVYDITTNTWDTTKASLPVAAGYAGVVASSDTLYAIGGTNGTSDINYAFQYNPTSNAWLTWEGPNKVRNTFGAAMTSLGIYVIGGKNNSGYFPDVEFATVRSLSIDYLLHLGDDTVNMTGNYARTYSDLSYTAPGFNVEFSRTYNSQDSRTNNIISTGWTFGFQGNIDIVGTNAIVRLPKGSGNTFQINGDGTYTAMDSRSTLVKNADNTYTLTTKDQYTYGFNSSGYLTSMKDRNGNTITITLDASNKPTQITDQVGRVTTIGYTNNKISSITDPAGRVVTYNYDANNRLYQVIDPNGSSTYYYYGSNGFISTVKDNTNSTVLESVTYLAAQGSKPARVSAVTDKYGNTTSYSYIESDGLITTTDSNGRTTSTWYDSSNYPICTKDAEGKESRTEYNLVDGFNKYGEAYKTIDRNGNATYYLRDSNGNVTKQINPDSSTKEYTYDNKNNVLSVKDEVGNYTFYVYDANGVNLIKTAQPLNGTDVFGVAPDANFAISVNTYYTGAEALSLFGKTIYGLLKTKADPEGGVTTYTYDTYGNIATIQNPTSKTTTYAYNKLGWLKSVTTPKGYVISYYYDKNGNLLKQVNPDSGVIRSVYDFRNNLTQKIMPTQYSASADTAVTFSGENIQNSASNAYTQTAHGYRNVYLSNGLLSTATDPCNNQTSYTYDQYGNKLTETKPNGAIYGYSYTVMNLTDTVTFKESAQSSAVTLQHYDYAILTNGSTTMTVTQYFSDTSTAVTKTTYDYAGRQIRLDQADNTHKTNSYNANGSLASTTDARGNTTYFAYDGLNRLIYQWSPVGSNTYAFTSTTYDKAGRIIMTAAAKELVPNGTVPTSNLMTDSFTYFADGKLQQELKSSGAKTTYTYDNDGNPLTKNVYYDATNYSQESYTFNNIEKLASKTVTVQNRDITGYDSSTNNLSLTSSYTYDKDGNILTSTDENGVVTTNTYDLMDRLLTTSQPGADENNAAVTITSSRTYDWAGKVLTATDPNNNTTTYTYDKQENVSKITNALNGVQYFVYDRAGHKLAEVSPKNYSSGAELTDMSRTEYSYDDMGRVLLVTQIYYDDETSSWKQFVSKAYTYDENGNVTYSQDALGYANGYGTTTEYDAANRVIKTTDPACQAANIDHTALYSYDALGRVLSKTDANNHVTSYTYNDDGKVLTSSVNGALTQTNTYDLQGNILTSTDGNGNVTTYAYNNLNQIRSMTLPGDGTIASLTTTYKYTKTGKPAEQLTNLGKQQVVTYDNQGHVLTTTEKKSDGTQIITTSNRYDKAGNLRYKVDPRGNTTQYTYDALGRNLTQAVTVTDANNNTTTQTTTFTYDANGNKLTEQNWRGNTVTYTYDPLNRVTLKTDPYGKTIEKLTYNNNGSQISSTDALNHTTQYVYDRDNRLVQTIDPMNNSTTLAYDGAGNVVQTLDGNNKSTYYTYNGFNRLIQVKDALNQITSYTYDVNGNMLTQTDASGNVTTMTYNCRNLPVQRIDAGGIGEGGAVDATKADTTAYNADGTVSSVTDKNGVTTTVEYDIHGRTLSTATDGVTISYTYDNNGNTLTMTDATGTTTRVYDQLGRTISKTVPEAGTSTFLYDVTNSIPTGCIGEVTTDGKGNVNTKIFDKAGRLSQIKVGSATTTYAYFDNGNRQSLTYPNGLTAEYTYYADNRLHTLANKNSGGAIINAYNYAYDGNGNLVTKLDNSGTTTYVYDDLNRLSSVTVPGGKVTTYTFDAAGNRAAQQVTDNGSVTNTMYTYNAQNQLLSAADIINGKTTTTSYCYDNNGNTVSSREETTDVTSGEGSVGLTVTGSDTSKYTLNTYDVFNQLVTTKDQDSTSTFTYNGDGLRVGKTVTKDNTTTTTKFVYEYDKVVLELDGSGNQTAYNVYGGDMLISRTAGTTTLYYLYNGHGDVVNIADSTGSIVMTYDYDAFGVVTTATGNIANSYLYAGYQFDDETGMYYLNARYYDPVTARFISADTYTGQASDPLSLNLYTYCNNEPMMFTDPTGHDSAPVTVYMPDGSIVQTTATNGITIMPDGSRPPVGAIVQTSSGGSWQMTSTGGVAVTTAPVTLPDGKNTVGTIVDNKTYLPDGSRPPEGAIVHTSGGDYQMVNGSGVKLTNEPTPKNKPDDPETRVGSTENKPTSNVGVTLYNYGDSDDDLKKVQSILYNLGYYYLLDYSCDGVFNKDTLAALMRFQMTYANFSWDQLFKNGKYVGLTSGTVYAIGQALSQYADYLAGKASSPKFNYGNSSDLVRNPTKYVSVKNGNVYANGNDNSSKYSTLTDEEKLIITTVYGEAGDCSASAWEAVANVIMNRVGTREWKKYDTVTKVIKYTGFDAYTYPNSAYKAAMNYLNNRDGSNAKLESLIKIVLDVYNGGTPDNTNGAVLYYSPRAMEALHDRDPKQYPNTKPSWNFDVLQEVTVKGAEKDDFKFYKYK
ncbi:kelch repeat-containing protein [Oscillospiraceae bacterium WX1]